MIVLVCLRSQNVCILRYNYCVTVSMSTALSFDTYSSSNFQEQHNSLEWEDRCNFKFYTVHVFAKTDNDIKKIKVQDYFKIIGSQIVLKLQFNIKIAS